MDQQEELDLLRNVKALTDHMTMVDAVFKAARLGRNMVLAFECGASGLFYPANYVSDWGRIYGDGQGPHVSSESLQTNYYIDPPEVTSRTKRISDIMHPLAVSFAQVDAHLVEVSAFADNMAILAMEDDDMAKRAPILYAKQLANPLSRVKKFSNMSVTEAAFEFKTKGGFR